VPPLSHTPDAGSHPLADQSRLYDEAAAAFGRALARLAVAYALLYGRHQGRRFQARIDDVDALTGGP